MKRFLLFTLIFGLFAVQADADLFHWTVHSLDLTYNGVNFNATASPAISGGNIDVTRDQPPKGTVSLFPGGGALGNFTITNMLISNVTATQADGAGWFTLTDDIGDTVTGNVTGVWELKGATPEFSGALSNVWWNNESGDNDFDGWQLVTLVPPTYAPGSISMGFAASLPWHGSMIQLTADTAPWFALGAWQAPVLSVGSVDAHVVPVPGAVLLGLLGLGAAGVKLRKYA